MAGTNRYDLVKGGTNNGAVAVQGGKYCFAVVIGTATNVQLQMLLDSTAVNIGTAFTASGVQVIEVPPTSVQAVVTGAITTTTISAITVPTITTR